VVGDLAERFSLIQEKRGARFARIWYWRQAFGSALRFAGRKAWEGGSGEGLLSPLNLARKSLSRQGNHEQACIYYGHEF
jgi:hypothetical protein